MHAVMETNSRKKIKAGKPITILCFAYFWMLNIFYFWHWSIAFSVWSDL